MLDGRWLDVAAVPLAFAVIRLGAGKGRTLVALVGLAHLVILANVALFPIPIDQAIVADGRATASSGAGGLNLVPFATIGPVVAGRALPIATRIAVLNVFVLTPAGIYLPLLFPTLRRWRALAPLVLLGGVSVEAAQLAISALLGFLYRAIDVDDVLLNATGILIGWLALKLAVRAGHLRNRATIPATARAGQSRPANR